MNLNTDFKKKILATASKQKFPDFIGISSVGKMLSERVNSTSTKLQGINPTEPFYLICCLLAIQV